MGNSFFLLVTFSVMNAIFVFQNNETHLNYF